MIDFTNIRRSVIAVMLAATALAAADEAQQAVAGAREAARRDRNAEAAALFEKAIQLAPARRFEWLREWADQLTYSGRASQAVPLYREAFTSGGLSSEDQRRARLGLALALGWSGQFEASLKEYDVLLKENPRDADARRERTQRVVEAAREAARQNRNAASAALFQRAIAEAPGRRMELLREFADQMTYSGNAAQAVPLYREALAHRPDRQARLGLALALAWTGQYEASLKEYDALLAADRGDTQALKQRTQRLVEAAREAARADRNADSAAWFRKAIAAAPARRREWLRELATQMTYAGEAQAAVPLFREVLGSGQWSQEDQRKARLGLALGLSWTEQLAPALREYDALIAADPKDIEARLGRARVLSWMGRLGPAKREYETVLGLEPGNVQALRDIARVQSWRGRQRDTQRRLAEFLRQYPDDKEGKLVLAQSQNWMGRSDRAAGTLQSLLDRHPDYAGGRKSLDAIDRERRPDTRLDYQTSTQSDHLAISRFSVEQNFQLAASHTTLSTGYQIYHYDPPEGQPGVEVKRPGAGLRSRLSDSTELNANAYLDQIDLAGVGPNHRTVTFDSWLTFRPNDTLRFDVGANRGTFDNLKSLTRNIIGTYATFSMDVTPSERTTLTTRFNWGAYSDGNRRGWGQVDVQRKLRGYPSLFVGGRYTAFGFSRNMDNGYFNPGSYQSGAATVHLYGRIHKKFEYDLDGSLGMEHTDSGGNKLASTGSVRLRYRLAQRLALEGRYEAFRSREASSGGFSRQTASVMLRFIW